MMRKLIILLLFFTCLRAEERDLAQYEMALYSPHGEDGVLQEIFQLTQPSMHLFVELGADDAATSSATRLLHMQQWSACRFDRLHENPPAGLFKAFLTAENVNDLLAKHNIPSYFPLLVIGTNYNSFHIWKALDAKYRPMVVLVGYNANHLPTQDKVVKYRPYYCGDNSDYFGASILALYNLGRAKGYSLIYADQSGTQLFFLRDDVIETKGLLFKNMNNINEIYRPGPTYRQDRKNRSYITSAELLP